MTLGLVSLVGAGPGDPDLLTLGAIKRLQRADVVYHDQLVGDAILELIPGHVRLVDVGKRGGRWSTDQRWIEEALITDAQAGRRVVRLKGGDPFVFGRGGEEAIALASAGIPCEVLPGVSSAFAAPAACGIPVTHRGVSTHVSVVTAVGGNDDQLRAAWRALAAAGGTVVFLMGLARLEAIVQEITASGRPLTTPMALISRGTTSAQRIVEGDVATILERARREGLEAPALIVLGEVVALRNTLALLSLDRDWKDELAELAG